MKGQLEMTRAYSTNIYVPNEKNVLLIVPGHQCTIHGVIPQPSTEVTD